MTAPRAAAAAAALTSLLAAGCHDLSRFSNDGDHYEGEIVAGDFVRAGFDATTRLCLVIDASRLQEETPGSISSSDARFASSPLRSIPQIWHDPLSTLSFGEGRVQNLVYVASPVPGVDPAGDAFAVVSLMQSGSIEVRVVRSAPPVFVGDGGAPTAPDTSLFGVFSLSRTPGACSF